jgi:hypothetical protein
MIFTTQSHRITTQGYCNQCGIADDSVRKQIFDFADGIFDLGLWNNFVCWPLRSAQNRGTGTTVFSLGGLGTFNGSMVNGPSWTATGMTVTASNMVVNTTYQPQVSLLSLFCAFKPSNTTGIDTRLTSCDQGGTSNGMGIDTYPAGQYRRTGYVYNFGTRTIGQYDFLGAGLGTNNTFTAENATFTQTSNLAYNISPTNFHVVGHPAAGAASGDYAFTALLVQAVNATLQSNLYSLYKSTLGQGLGLP